MTKAASVQNLLDKSLVQASIELRTERRSGRRFSRLSSSEVGPDEGDVNASLLPRSSIDE